VSSRILRVCAALTVLGLLVAGGYAVYHAFNGPAQADIRPAPTANAPAKAVTGTAVLRARYFSLTYDNSYKTVTNISAQDPSAREQYRLSGGSNLQHIDAVISVRSLPHGGITEDSSYHLRSLQPDLYTLRTVAAEGGAELAIMTKQDGSEATAFVQHQSLEATLSVTTNRPDIQVGSEAEKLARAFQWAP
jgi:hypothetical protein